MKSSLKGKVCFVRVSKELLTSAGIVHNALVMTASSMASSGNIILASVLRDLADELRGPALNLRSIIENDNKRRRR